MANPRTIIKTANQAPRKPATPVAKPSAIAGEPRRRKRLPVLPLLMGIGVVLFGIKLGDLWTGGDAVVVGIRSAGAQQQPAAPAGQAGAPAQPAATPPNPSDAVASRAGANAGGPINFTRSELEVLQGLTARRAELDARARDMELRENLLKAAAERLEQKFAELKKIEATIQALLKQHDDEQEQKLRKLVKVYETMKPKEAAPIFNQLDMEMLLDITERMKEAKIAPILAVMDTAKATDLSTRLAQRRKLPETGS